MSPETWDDSYAIYHTGADGKIGDLPTKYISIQLAGEGYAGAVHFCLPTSVVNGGKVASKDTAQPAAHWVKQLVAVKVQNSGTVNSVIGREVDLLSMIQCHAHLSNMSKRVTQLIDHDVERIPRWYTLGAYVTGFTLAQFMQPFGTKPVPEELVFHCFIQLGEALTFLHRVCDPPLAHRDLHGGNIMVDPTTQEVPGFPNIILIDFGTAISPARSESVEFDFRSLCNELIWVAKENRRCAKYLDEQPHNELGCEHPPGWIDLQRALAMPEFYNDVAAAQETTGLAVVQAQLMDMAISARSQTPVEKLQLLTEAVEKLAKGRQEVLENNIQTVLQSKRGGISDTGT